MPEKDTLPERFTDGMTFGKSIPLSSIENPRFQEGYKAAKAGIELTPEQKADSIILCAYAAGCIEKVQELKKKSANLGDKPKLPERFTDGMVINIIHPSEVRSPRFKEGYNAGLAGTAPTKEESTDVLWLSGYDSGLREREKAK